MKIRPSSYVIDPIFPTREIHIIAGASGAGKSTLLAQIADSLLTGNDIFGYSPNPISGIAYLAFDRSHEGMGRTFERTLQRAETPFPFYSTIDSPEFSSPESRDPAGAIKQIKTLHPEVDVLLLDGIGVAFKGDSGKLSEVAGFVHNLVRALKSTKSPLTVFANHHISKQKKGNEYANARARLHGSVAWAATAETIILVEAEAEDDPENPNRILTLCPRNAPERSYTYCFDEHGRLIPGNKLSDPTNESKKLFFKLVNVLTEGELVTTDDLYTLTEPMKISRATFKRWLKDVIETTGDLERIGHGTYRRRSKKPN